MVLQDKISGYYCILAILRMEGTFAWRILILIDGGKFLVLYSLGSGMRFIFEINIISNTLKIPKFYLLLN